MANSKIDICNLALATVGADAIRSFDDRDKRARMCDVMYDHTRDYLLEKFDWNLARRFATLNEVDAAAMGIEVPEGERLFSYPVGCLAVRDLYPLGSRDKWQVMGKYLYTSKTGDIQVYYTIKETDTAVFTSGFSNILALALAVRLAAPISQDKALVSALYTQYKNELPDVLETDANENNSYKDSDDEPDNDSFVDPDIGTLVAAKTWAE